MISSSLNVISGDLYTYDRGTFIECQQSSSYKKTNFSVYFERENYQNDVKRLQDELLSFFQDLGGRTVQIMDKILKTF